MSTRSGKTGVKPIKHKERRQLLVDLHNNYCLDCGIRFPSYVYEFHHRDPKEKEFSLGGKDLNRKWEKVMIEASKCDMLCANCHKKRHYNMEKDK